MVTSPIHYTGILPAAALVLVTASALAALRAMYRRGYYMLTALLFALIGIIGGVTGSTLYAAISALLLLASKILSLKLARPLQLLKTSIILIVVGWLVYWIPFVKLDFTLHEVFWNTSPGLPLWMRFASAWSGGGGSLFLFALMASLSSMYLVKGNSSSRATPPLIAGLSAVIAVGIIAAFMNDAFTHLAERPASGAGLNPLLKSPWLYPHPLTTFGGYALLAVASVGLLAGLGRRAWIVYEIGWAMLTVGIMLGGYWSYETFGWGGYWAWDPVETSELMVWLASTLLPHVTVSVRGLSRFSASFMASSVFLAMYVTRTGLSPLHSFAAPGIGALVLLASALLYLAYSIRVLGGEADRLLGDLRNLIASRRPYALGLVTASLTLFAAAIFVYSTLLVPSMLIVEGKQVSVPQMGSGIEYFHPVLYPLLLVMLAALPLVFLGEWIGWRGYFALLASTIALSVSMGLAVVRGLYDLAPLSPLKTRIMMAFGLPLAGIAAASTILYVVLRLRRSGLVVVLRDRLTSMSILHLGLSLTVIGVLVSGTYAFNDVYTWEAHLRPGNTITVAGGHNISLLSYDFNISESTVDIYTNYAGRSSIYFYAWQGLQALATDLGHLVYLYDHGSKEYTSNTTIQLLSNLSTLSPYELDYNISETLDANITIVEFETTTGNTTSIPVYKGKVKITITNPVVQVGFDINTRGKEPEGFVNAYIEVDFLNITAVGGRMAPIKNSLGVHEIALLDFNKPLKIKVKDDGRPFTILVREAALYSEALLRGGRGSPLRIANKSIAGPNALLYVGNGTFIVEGREISIPYTLSPAVATYVLVEESPGTRALLSMIRERAPSLYSMLASPSRIFNLTVSKACLASPQGCVAYVNGPRLVPETAWLDVTLGVDGKPVNARIRFEAYGEIQGIHGLVSKVIHPSLGLDDVYVVISPPVRLGRLSHSNYHELLLYYLHEAFKDMPPEKRLALAALMASGYNIDVLRRLSGPQLLERLEPAILDLYIEASSYNASASNIVSEGLYVQVKVIPGVRLVWFGPILMAFGALYAALMSIRRRG